MIDSFEYGVEERLYIAEVDRPAHHLVERSAQV